MKMANTTLFQSIKNRLTKTDTYNEAGGIAYTLTPKQQLAQLAATGCLNNTYYADAQSQLDQVLKLAENLDAEFIAKTAVYSRQKGFMKDMPALLLAVLAQKDVNMLARVFDQVVDNGKMLRNFAQIIRSGAVGRKSFGNRPKKLMQTWLLTATEKQLLNAAVGNSPSLADVVKMVHPKPREAWRAAWFAWLIGKPYDREALPPITRAFEDYKQSREGELPNVPFQMLTALDLNSGDWAEIARNGSWQQVRQNLNTFLRHEVFAKSKNIKMVAEKLRDETAIARARVLPYQLLTAYQATSNQMPFEIREALQDAMETAVQNVPAIQGKVVVCPDVSGSMHSSVTGHRGSATSKTRCIDIAALVSAAMLRTNPQARVIPFEQITVNVQLNPRDSIMTNAEKLANIGGGGTACSAPLAMLNREKADVDLVVIVSDNESWADDSQQWGATTSLMKEWDILKRRCPEAKLVCLDIQPYVQAQARNRHDILNIGGFSDQVFTLIGSFAERGMGTDFWVEEIEKTELAAVN
ncbi:MAG: TROVE domain-containing protein [Neisseria sp.]|uniref:vWA domain-containing protein n=1 Tax=unclassified Neisseria TaxID=2623750 RepID=UPI0008A8ABF5|nr:MULTISPECIES: TROVE domain-containing protein [unclassified Neisseria]MBF1271246.1 TROVE domain-containing protein [Neisseria sp.]OHR10692.1 RNA-binding protein [Neisseria sp. HMSC078C12]